MRDLFIFNTLSRKKEKFVPIQPPQVGMYVCGPTVYGDPHLGHARGFLSFDILYRYLIQLGYSVRYVRNITDVGHLTDDMNDEGEDKVQKRAVLERKEPMEISQYYTNLFNDSMDALNLLRPGIEPRATGHIPEQIRLVQDIMDKGLAYEVNGSVYFDVKKYNETFPYGKLSGRNLEDLEAGGQGRKLEGQSEKRFEADFALWKTAPENHIMKWDSPWGVGFPGWHLECTVMSTKYLGTKYDIHGGGMDLIFPHHEAEVAQSNACLDPTHTHLHDEARYWVHNNMITINGKKMGKSLNNFITIDELFSGKHDLLTQSFSPMAIRFFVLQAHYRSTLDFSNDALISSEKALKRLSAALEKLNSFEFNKTEDYPEHPYYDAIGSFEENCHQSMGDDLNTAKVIAKMFDLVPFINEANANKDVPFPKSKEEMESFRASFNLFFFEILGLKIEGSSSDGSALVDGMMDLILDIRADVRSEKNWAMADKIRDSLKSLKVIVKDTKEGAQWHIGDE